MEGNISPERIYIIMGIGILMMLSFAAALVLFFFKSQKKLLEKQLQNRQLQLEHQQKLTYATFEVQEQERTRIAQDLHDEVGAKLSVLFLNLHQLKRFTKDSESVQVLEGMRSVIERTIETTRRISHDLLPPTLEKFGLVAAVNELFASVQKQSEITIAFDVYESEKLLRNSRSDLHLFRVVQELLNNTIKHAGADEISLKMWSDTDSLRVEYTDNGQGFDLQGSDMPKGLGMQNIESRLSMIKAEYQMVSAPGEGMKMSIRKV